MNKFYLPEMKKITITDYALYKCPVIIDFSSKLNIVFGTNGTGKSTLLMIILFSIIGPYRGGIKTKVRLEQRKDNRPIYSEDFFKNRAISEIGDAKVKAEFSINNDEYIVEHSLDGKLLSVSVNNMTLDGKIISYRTFESKFSKKRENILLYNDDDELEGYLINNYHNEIEKSTCLHGGVNTLISMLLDVMFFDEGRNFTFWNADLQETIISKYIVDKKFYEDYCEKKLETKALESSYKKKSETLNFMKKFIEKEKMAKSSNSDLDETTLRFQLLEIEDNINKMETEINELRGQYKRQNENLLNVLKEIEKTREKIQQLDETWYNNLFPNQYNKFYQRFSNKMMANECPVCGKRHPFSIETEKCIFCDEMLEINPTPDLVSVDIERKNQQIVLSQKSMEMDNLKQDLATLQKLISDNKKNVEQMMARKNQIEVDLKPNNSLVDDNDTKRLDIAKQERDEELKKLNACKDEETSMRMTIENSLVANFKEFSSTFTKYAHSFFGDEHEVKLSLPFKNKDDQSDDMMIKFKLDNKDRSESFMLSESQRIFTDLAFRFSILTAFHEKSFFMCETPDSTLDMFHENNAVRTFKEYIDRGNSLILTANARRSNLISKLYSEFENDDVKIIDLTVISNLSMPGIINFYDYIGGVY